MTKIKVLIIALLLVSPFHPTAAFANATTAEWTAESIKYIANLYCSHCTVFHPGLTEAQCVEKTVDYYEDACGDDLVQNKDSGQYSIECHLNGLPPQESSFELYEFMQKLNSQLSLDKGDLATCDQYKSFFNLCGNYKVNAGEACDQGPTGGALCTSQCTFKQVKPHKISPINAPPGFGGGNIDLTR